ncbi:MAG: hypothetical protein ABIK09_14810 [Pseudomonadota bacterium]
MGTLMSRRLLPIILLWFLGFPGEVAAQELEIPPGMSPRPTPECGGAPMMALWEAERIERLEEIAGRAVGTWTHAMEPRLTEASRGVERALVEETLSLYHVCLAAQPPRSDVCVAAASGRPDLCEAEDDPGKRGMCRMVAMAVVASETGDPTPCDLLETPARRDTCFFGATGRPRCTAGAAACLRSLWLTPGSCRIPGILSSWVTGLRFFCRWALWIEAARGVGGCDDGLGGAWRDGCLAVAARAPGACPSPGRFETGLILDSQCRDAAVGRILAPAVQWADGAATLSVVLYNPFQEAARCVLHLEAEASDGAVRRGTSPPFVLAGNARAWRGVTLPLDLRVVPASRDWSWRVLPDCAFALHVLEGGGEAGSGAFTTFDG